MDRRTATGNGNLYRNAEREQRYGNQRPRHSQMSIELKVARNTTSRRFKVELSIVSLLWRRLAHSPFEEFAGSIQYSRRCIMDGFESTNFATSSFVRTLSEAPGELSK